MVSLTNFQCQHRQPSEIESPVSFSGPESTSVSSSRFTDIDVSANGSAQIAVTMSTENGGSSGGTCTFKGGDYFKDFYQRGGRGGAVYRGNLV